MWWTVLPIILLPMPSQARLDCSKEEYGKCVRIADPLVKEAHLVFPDNINDIDQVCTTWNKFVDCLKVYTDDCFTDQQRKQFNRAVESPIESVHQMCMQPSYQKEYLQYAPCIKNTIIQRIHCGPQYNLLVDQVDQGDVISKSTLCCSHDRFKQCVQRETRRLCDRGMPDGPATRFATQIIDKALSFMQDQCLNYIPNSGDCTVRPTDNLPYADRSDPFVISTSSSEVFPWTTAQALKPTNEVLPSRVTPLKISTTSPWDSSSSATSDNAPSNGFSTQMLGSRTRPGSYGRSSSWSEGNNGQVLGNTVQMYPEVPSTASAKPDWATFSTWGERGQTTEIKSSGTTINVDTAYSSTSKPWEASSEAWYPAAGNQLNNEVDEPNQLGLKKPRNTAGIKSEALSLIFLTIFLALEC